MLDVLVLVCLALAQGWMLGRFITGFAEGLWPTLFAGLIALPAGALEPALDRLDGNGNLPFSVDFRDIYATVLQRWWGTDSSAALRGRFQPLPFLTA